MYVSTWLLNVTMAHILKTDTFYLQFAYTDIFHSFNLFQNLSRSISRTLLSAISNCNPRQEQKLLDGARILIAIVISLIRDLPLAGSFLRVSVIYWRINKRLANRWLEAAFSRLSLS